jgi:hypothetical protein
MASKNEKLFDNKEVKKGKIKSFALIPPKCTEQTLRNPDDPVFIWISDPS